MTSYKFSMRIDELDILKNGRSKYPHVHNRFLVQLLAPSDTTHPTSVFTLPTEYDGKGPVPADVYTEDLPFGLLFKAEDFKSVLGEPLRIRVHHLQDTKKDPLQIIVGRLVKLAIENVLGEVSVLGVKLSVILKIPDNLDLDSKCYSQKLGAVELDLTPADFTNEIYIGQFNTVADKTVQHYKIVGPSNTPQKATVVKEGAITSALRATLKLSEV